MFVNCMLLKVLQSSSAKNIISSGIHRVSLYDFSISLSMIDIANEVALSSENNQQYELSRICRHSFYNHYMLLRIVLYKK